MGQETGDVVNALPPAAERVRQAATALGLAIDIRVMPAATRTAEEAAAACGCTVAQIVKSLIFKGKESERPYLLLVSGTNRVNEKAVGARLGETIVRPDADFVRAATGFAIGGVSPLGHTPPLVPYLDTDLLQYGTVWAAAGTPNAVFEVDPRKLRDATGAVVMLVT
ncbi:MAG TPA: YbaK/EbsC family protein [Bauldia sp.]|nr:YbaK/EbsC family protein [Bauldia sp.]